MYTLMIFIYSNTRYGGVCVDKEIMKGSIDILILSIIQKQDTYGYEIAKWIKEKSEGLYAMSEGTLYPALKRMEGKKLIESYWVENELTGKRKYYRITENGRKTLNERISEWNKVTCLINTFKEG